MTYYYMDFLGGVIFSTSFDQFFGWFLSGFWWLWVVSWSHFWQLMIYHIWQLYMRANFPNNPAGNDINFRIITSLHLPNTKFFWFIIGNPGPEPPRMHGIWTVRGPKLLAWTERGPSLNRASKDLLSLAKDLLLLAKGQLLPWIEHEPSVKP